MTIGEKYNHFIHDLEGLQFHIMAISVLGYCCIVIPFTILSISIFNAPGIEFIIACVGGIAILVANLDDAPVKMIFNIFLIAVAIDLLMIIINFFI